MVEVTIDEEIHTGAPGIEIVETTATTAYTYRSRRFGAISGCILGFNYASGYVDEMGTAAISGQQVTLEIINTGGGGDTSAVPISIVVFGKTGRSP